MVSNYILWGATAVPFGLSLAKDRVRTRNALVKAWKSFENILPDFLGVITLVGILIAALNPEVISRLLGSQSGWLGVVLAAVVGAVTLIPGFVAFPMAAMLLQNGAGYMQMGAFISALMMVGVVTLPVEFRYFGKRLSVMRNLLAFAFSFLVAFIIQEVVG